jgi:CDP-diacylglycerol--glycerol-3-phosphate 3-phosphatidyltransferase
MKTITRILPPGLITFRFLLGPILLIDAFAGHTGILFGISLIAALMSDIFDGVIARRIGTATARLRELDSWVDGWFCLCVAACVWFAHRETVITFAPLIIAWFATDLLALFFDWIKFRRFASYHAYSSKLAGLLLFIAIFILFTFHVNNFILTLALIVAIVSHLERMLITAVMPCWTPDVAGFWKAVKLRKIDDAHNNY